MTDSSDLITELTSKLSLSDPGLVGCRRRGKWSTEEPWRHARGNALLRVLGDRHYVTTPVGTFESYLRDSRHLLQFRGGPWKPWWVQDFFDAWALMDHYGGDHLGLSRQILALHENRGELRAQATQVPESIQAAERALTAIEEYTTDPPGRIPKHGGRALAVCRHCPVKLRCDATDKSRDETDDWNPSYPEP